MCKYVGNIETVNTFYKARS